MPVMTPLLRAATAADAARVADLLIETRQAFMPYAPMAHAEHDVRQWVASTLVPGGGVVVAETGGWIVGVMATAADAQCTWITQMAVEPGRVGHGIGTCLLTRAVQTLAQPIRLWTFQQNLGARRFYERHGFVPARFTDGQDNEERCPDVLYELKRT